MKTEHEVKVLEIDPELIKQTLEHLGAVALGTTLQWRYVFDIAPDDKSQWLRLRSEREGVTFTHKKIESDEIDGTSETSSLLESLEGMKKVIESAGIEVGQFNAFWSSLEEKDRTTEKILKYLEQIGITPKYYQENRRTSFKLDGCDIEIDEWPKIPPYLEIEGEEKAAVLRMAERLGFEPEELTSVNTTGVYNLYGLNIADYPRLTFED
jgi:adenylate cyclase class 2